MNMDVRSKLIASGWRQGALIFNFKEDDFNTHAHIELDENDIYVVISQTCDLINPDFNNEPFFEVLRISKTNSEPQNEYTGGKNSREIHFQIELDGEVTTFRALPYERFFVDRQLLNSNSPDAYLTDETREMLSAWLIKRFSRAAFPDTYDQRWKGRLKQIERVIKRLKLIEDIYIKILPFEEVDDGTKYQVEIYILMDADNYDSPIIYEEYTSHAKSLEDQFNQCDGIDVQLVELRSNADITVREIQELKRWDYSYLSYREPDEHARPNVE